MQPLAGTEARRRTGVVDITRQIPAQHVVPILVLVGILVEHAGILGSQLADSLGRQNLVELVLNPRDGTSRNQSGSDNPEADFRTDETHFGIWMDHGVLRVIWKV